jgi:hypothetical protein
MESAAAFMPAAGLMKVYKDPRHRTIEEARLNLCRKFSGFVQQDLSQKKREATESLASCCRLNPEYETLHIKENRATRMYNMVCSEEFPYELEIWQTLWDRTRARAWKILSFTLFMASYKALDNDYGYEEFGVDDEIANPYFYKLITVLGATIELIDPSIPISDEDRTRLELRIKDCNIPLGRFYKLPKFDEYGRQVHGFTPSSARRVCRILERLMVFAGKCSRFLQFPQRLPSCIVLHLQYLRDGIPDAHAACALLTGPRQYSIVDPTRVIMKTHVFDRQWSDVHADMHVEFDRYIHATQSNVESQKLAVCADRGEGDCMSQTTRTIMLGYVFKNPDDTIDVPHLAQAIHPSEDTKRKFEDIERIKETEDGGVQAVVLDKASAREIGLYEYNHVQSQMLVSTIVQEFMADMCEDDTSPLEYYVCPNVVSKPLYESEVDTAPMAGPSPLTAEPILTQMMPWKLILPYVDRLKRVHRPPGVQADDPRRTRRLVAGILENPGRAGADFALRF